MEYFLMMWFVITYAFSYIKMKVRSLQREKSSSPTKCFDVII
jgi:hypothetical protein